MFVFAWCGPNWESYNFAATTDPRNVYLMMTPEEVSQSTIENKTTGDSKLEVEVGRFFGESNLMATTFSILHFGAVIWIGLFGLWNWNLWDPSLIDLGPPIISRLNISGFLYKNAGDKTPLLYKSSLSRLTNLGCWPRHRRRGATPRAEGGTIIASSSSPS